MASAQTFVWYHVFSFPQPTKPVSQKTANFLLKDKLYVESDLPTINHLLNFEKIDKFHNIFYDNVKCRLFFLTFKGRIMS